MPLEDLNILLSKDPVIATYGSSQLETMPEQVEHVYRTYARTHVPLGNTEEYVDRVFRYIGGANAGAFVGAVSGNMGEGKTSYQVHLWDRCAEHGVLAVPPFWWASVPDILTGTAAWVRFLLSGSHPDTARKVALLHSQYREKSLREIADETAAQTGQPVDVAYAGLKAGVDAGRIQETTVTPDRVLEFWAEVTELIEAAGYRGLLVLLDEPETAARKLGEDKAVLVLFELANGLLQRQGNYGAFISIQERFLAAAMRRYPALTARLQGRGCFPRLGDMYGSDFAAALWTRYAEQFGLGAVADRIISPDALTALGQLTCSDRRDLSYGPRTVVSVFRRIVQHHKDVGRPYAPEDLVMDCLLDEVMVAPDYRTKVQQAVNHPEAKDADQRYIRLLAAYPNGMPGEIAVRLGIGEVIHKLRERGIPIYRRGQLVGLESMRKSAGPGPGNEDELSEAINTIAGQFAPGRDALNTARDAFIEHLLPTLFEKRAGLQLVGWEDQGNWDTFGKTLVTSKIGAFRQTEKDFPRRTVMVAIGPADDDPSAVGRAIATVSTTPDVVVHLALRWDPETPEPERWIDLSPGNPAEQEPATIRLVLDLVGDPIHHDIVQQAIEEDLSPFGLLYLIREMGRVALSPEFDPAWQSVRKQLLRDLVNRFLGSPEVREQASEQIGHTLSSAAPDLIGSIARLTLLARYPEYSTLIRQPRWQDTVTEYERVLRDEQIPRACKRGNEPWVAPGDTVVRTFNTNRMNLTGSGIAQLDNLIKFDVEARSGPISVTFRLHPLERDLMARMMQDGTRGRRRIDGKECWWLPLEEVLPSLVASGYLVEEIRHIVRIGEARETFKAKKDESGRLILYCPPLDIEQMKVQLREKLRALVEEIEAFRQLPDYHSSFDAAAVTAQIEAIADEAQYDQLALRVGKESEQNRARLPGLFDRLNERWTNVSTRATNTKTSLTNSREAAQLQQAVSGDSTWLASLKEYIVPALKRSIQTIVGACDTADRDATQAASRYASDRPGKTLERVAALVEGFGTATELDARVAGVADEVSTTLARLREYEEWRTLLIQSDALHTSLVELKGDPAHLAKAGEFLAELKRIWDEMAGDLTTLNITGLGSHGQYSRQIRELDQKRRVYIQQLRSAYEQEKEKVNRLMDGLKLGVEARCKEIFNPADVQACYDRLHAEAGEHISRVLAVERAGLQAEMSEMLYTRDILRRASKEEVAPLLDRGRVSEEQLQDASRYVTPDQIASMLEDGSAARAALAKAIQCARDAIRDARLLARRDGGGEDQLAEAPSKMLALVPDPGAIDLKQAVLGMMAAGCESGQALNVSLDALADLFRKGKVQVKVERPRR